MVEKGTRGRILHSIYLYVKVNNNSMKDCGKKCIAVSSILGWNNLYGWAMSQKLPVNNFEWIKDNSHFNKDFIKNCDKKCDEGYFFKVDVQCIEKLHGTDNDLPFLPQRMKSF